MANLEVLCWFRSYLFTLIDQSQYGCSDSQLRSQRTNVLQELRFTGNPRTSFLTKFLRSNPLSRAHRLMPIFLIRVLTSSPATTLAVLPYSVDLNSNTLGSSPSLHLRPGLLSDITEIACNNINNPRVSDLHGVPSSDRLLDSGCSWYWTNRCASWEGMTTLCDRFAVAGIITACGLSSQPTVTGERSPGEGAFCRRYTPTRQTLGGVVSFGKNSATPSTRVHLLILVMRRTMGRERNTSTIRRLGLF
jgi:hypothetical protein